MALMAVSAQRLGHYRLLSRLGYGGMAEIYLAWDEREQREVALKVVDMAQDDHVQRFQREVEALRLLKHEHILPIFDCDQQDGWAYFAMPYLPLGSLRDRLRHGPLPLEEAGGIFMQVAGALHYAHEQGVLHRDIKPSNILFRDERSVYLADFGLAKLVEQEGSITRTGCLIGTPHYLAPELASADASQSSDQYALGVLLYKMLTGIVPFRGASAISICWKHIHDSPLPPSSLNPAIPPAIDRLILQALAKDPADRFHSVQQMAQAYQQALWEVQLSRITGAWSRYFPWPYLHTQRRYSSPSIEIRKVQKSRSRHPTLNGIYRAITVGAMMLVFCVAPFYLGFSLDREHMEPVSLSASVQATSLEAKPFLAGNNAPMPTRGQAVSLALSPKFTLSASRTPPSQQWLPGGQSQEDDGDTMKSQQVGLTQAKTDGGKGQGQTQTKRHGKHHHSHGKARKVLRHGLKNRGKEV